MLIAIIIMAAFIVALSVAAFDLLKLLRENDKELAALGDQIAKLHDEDARLAQHKHLRGKVVLPDKD